MIKIAFTEYRFALSAERAVIYHVKVDVFSARQREGIFTWLGATATNGSTEMSFVVTAALLHGRFASRVRKLQCYQQKAVIFERSYQLHVYP